ncbi:MAG: Swt1 family HEPN domain-containing protein [Patescibacteria group bacterium]|nr:Swt1 family HEPN domain-containing protein [Patescibacteria group bacterium]
MINKAQNFIFKAMLLNTELEAFKDIGIISEESPSLDKKATDEKRISIESFPTVIRLNAIKMSSVYMAFFAFENSVRDLIKERLSGKEHLGINWWDKGVAENIRKKVIDRKGKDSKNKWHAPRAIDNIAYADFGDMANIIINNWEHFEDILPSQDWIKTRLSDLEQSRNALAHNNVLEERDILRIKMYLEDWLNQTG